MNQVNELSARLSEIRSVILTGIGGITGIWYARLLMNRGYRVFGHDLRENIQLPADITEHSLFEMYTGQPATGLTLTPGVPLKSEFIQNLLENDTPPFLFTELEFGLTLLPPLKIAAITGTDGKSTTTELLHHLLSRAGYSSYAGGNLGSPLSQFILEKNLQSDDILVLELSSYQLESARNLKPHTAVYLNLAPDHLDRYDSLEDYCRAKWNIIQNADSDTELIINRKLLRPHDTIISGMHPAESFSGRIIEIDTERLFSPSYVFTESLLNDSGGRALSLESLPLKGRHNAANILFALEACNSLTGSPADLDLLISFSPLPHRFEIIHSSDDNLFINDSKATTTQAAMTAIRNTADPLFLFAGGAGKGEDYTELAESLKNRRVQVYLFGAEADTMQQVFSSAGIDSVTVSQKLEQVFTAAITKRAGLTERVTWLLAPAATSWDQYKSFQHRGDHFRELVSEYLQQKS